MRERTPTHATIDTGNGPRLIPIARWLELSAAEMVQLIARENVHFSNGGRPVPVREALASLKTTA